MTTAGNVTMTLALQAKAAEFTGQFGRDTQTLFQTLGTELQAESSRFSGSYKDQFDKVLIDVMENSGAIAHQIAIMDAKMAKAAVDLDRTSTEGAEVLRIVQNATPLTSNLNK